MTAHHLGNDAAMLTEKVVSLQTPYRRLHADSPNAKTPMTDSFVQK